MSRAVSFSYDPEMFKQVILKETKTKRPLEKNGDKYEIHIVEPSTSILDAIKIIEPYLQTRTQIRNIEFLKAFNQMYLSMTEVMKKHGNILDQETYSGLSTAIKMADKLIK